MIHIKRTYPPPQSIVSDAANEHLSAHIHFRSSSDTFKHVVFTKKDVKKALEKLFNGKCAYCESNVVKTSAIDKEHFRPKASIRDKHLGIHIKPGYYWLAADWDNLLLACANCNRTGTHEDISGGKFTTGKLDRFPLSDESKRMKYGGSFKAEEKVRLLINPCVDKPESWIEYGHDGSINPKRGISLHNKAKVDTSVEIFGLMRSHLVNAREEKCLDLLDVIQDIKLFYSKYLASNDPENLRQLKRKLSQLDRFRKDDREYLGITRYIIKKELKNLKKISSTT